MGGVGGFPLQGANCGRIGVALLNFHFTARHGNGG